MVEHIKTLFKKKHYITRRRIFSVFRKENEKPIYKIEESEFTYYEERGLLGHWTRTMLIEVDDESQFIYYLKDSEADGWKEK